MAKKDRNRQRIKQKRAAKVRERRIRRDRQRTGSGPIASAHDSQEDMHEYDTPFGTIVSSQNPEKMHLRQIGDIRIYRPRIEAEIHVRQEAEKILREKYPPGKYTDANQINQILQDHFHFFDQELKNIIPRIGSRHLMSFVLTQYDHSCKVDAQFKKGALSTEHRKYWQNVGFGWRRALKYLAECNCLLAPDEVPAAPDHEILDLTDRAMICAEQLVQLSTLSDQTYMLFPDQTELVISAPGELDYLNVQVHPKIGADFQERVRLDLNVRGKYIELDYPLFDKKIRAAELNDGFSQVFGISYEECFEIIAPILENVQLPPGSFPIAFVERHQMISNVSTLTGMSPDLSTKLLDGITISRANMVAEGRKVWKPKQEHRAYRRLFFEFPHESGPHLAWSDGMAKECAMVLLRDLAFQHVPPEWKEPPISAALATLSNRCGKEFERICIDQMKERGFTIASGFKDGIGTGKNRVLIPKLVGELDCLAYEPTRRLLLLLECKLVQSGTEAARFRDDIHQFTNVKNGYFLKYERKLQWVQENIALICKALESIPNVQIPVIPIHLAGAIVTLYPSFTSYFKPPVPCVSIGELLSEWDSQQGWPYQKGVFAL